MYCIKCFKYCAKHKLQNINRCCRSQICKICMKRSYYMMCFYCKAHSSRYMQKEGLLFDKAYKYRIRKYKYKDIIYQCMWYIDFNYDREGNKFTCIYLNRNGKVSELECQSNGKFHRNYDKPTFIDFGSIIKGEYNDNDNDNDNDNVDDRIIFLAWHQKGMRHRKENKPSYILLHLNGTIRYLEWNYNNVLLHINKLNNVTFNENGDIY